MAGSAVDVDLPPGIEITGCRRYRTAMAGGAVALARPMPL